MSSLEDRVWKLFLVLMTIASLGVAGFVGFKLVAQPSSSPAPSSPPPTAVAQSTPVPAPPPQAVATATLVVAASNASPLSKARADLVADGVDDQVEIQTAIDAVNAVGGGRVVLSEGRFNISATINMRNGVYLEGQGMGSSLARATELYLVDGANTSMVVFDSGALPFHGSGLEKMSLQGNRTNQNATSHGVVITTSQAQPTSHIYFEDVEVDRFRNRAVSIVTGLAGIDTLDFRNVHMSASDIGLYIASPSPEYLLWDFSFVGAVWGVNRVNIYIAPEGMSNDTRFVGSINDIRFVGSVIDQAIEESIILEGATWIQFVGNHISDASMFTPNTHDLVVLRQNAAGEQTQYITFVGNQLRGFFHARYLLSILDRSDRIVLVGNVLEGWATGAVNIAPGANANSAIAGNIGY